MGVIYPSTELATGHTPGVGYHEDAARMIIDRLPTIDGVNLTVVHGSVAEGRGNIRSDLDVLVTYTAESPTHEPVIVEGVKRVVEAVQQQTHVRVEPNIWPADEPLDARAHRMYDRLFAHHLSRAMRRDTWAVGEPDPLIDEIVAQELTSGSLRELILNYLTYKHQGVTKAPQAYTESSTAALFGLQRVLEFPKALGRKLLQIEGDLVPDKGADPLDVFQRADVPEEVAAQIERLMLMDSEYTQILESYSLYKVPNKRLVEDYFRFLKDRYPTAMAAGLIAISGFTRHVAAQ